MKRRIQRLTGAEVYVVNSTMEDDMAGVKMNRGP